jgi:hypothetical protein
MSEQAPPVEERVERLARELKLTRWFGALAFVLVFVQARFFQPDVIEARTFRVQGADGTVVATLGEDSNGGGQLQIFKKGSSMTIDSATVQVSIGRTCPDGGGTCPGPSLFLSPVSIDLQDPTGSGPDPGYISLTLSEGHPQLVVIDSEKGELVKIPPDTPGA